MALYMGKWVYEQPYFRALFHPIYNWFLGQPSIKQFDSSTSGDSEFSQLSQLLVPQLIAPHL